MFEKYDISELFLASINVMFPDDTPFDFNMGNAIVSSPAGWGYLTVLRKVDDNKYVDLQYLKVPITIERDPNKRSYVMSYIEPLSHYYTQEGDLKTSFSRRQAKQLAKKYYHAFNIQSN
jgi:hypothetical protein